MEGVTDRGTEGHLRCVCGNGLAGFEYLPMNETISAIRKRFEMGGGGGCVRNMCQVIRKRFEMVGGGGYVRNI